MATHKSGNQLDLIYTRHCSTDHVMVTPLHTSDHFLLTLNLNMVPDTTHTPPHAHSQPPGLSAMVSSSLPPPKQLSCLFCDQHFFLISFNTQHHNITSTQNKQNKTTDTYATPYKSSQKEEREGGKKKKTKQVIPLYNHVC